MTHQHDYLDIQGSQRKNQHQVRAFAYNAEGQVVSRRDYWAVGGINSNGQRDWQQASAAALPNRRYVISNGQQWAELTQGAPARNEDPAVEGRQCGKATSERRSVLTTGPVKAMALALFASAGLVGCFARWTVPVQASEEFSAEHAYIYGRFHIDAPTSEVGFLRKEESAAIGFEIACDDNAKYTIRFNAVSGVQAIRVAPARCGIRRIIYTEFTGEIIGEDPPPPKVFVDSKLLAGHAYYIGDFEAEHQRYGLSATWSLNGVSRDFEKTTTVLRSENPSAGRLRFVDALGL